MALVAEAGGIGHIGDVLSAAEELFGQVYTQLGLEGVGGRPFAALKTRSR